MTFDDATLDVKSTETRLRHAPIAANLRHDRLNGVLIDATLAGEAPADYAFATELAFASRLARHLKSAREVVRGKPEKFNRLDHAFRLVGADRENTVDDGAEPRGEERAKQTAST